MTKHGWHTSRLILSPEEVAATRARFRRERLLMDLAEEGASRCVYMPGAGNPEAWPESRCDCKYLGPYLGRPEDARPNSELTGCCEIRAAYAVVKEHR